MIPITQDGWILRSEDSKETVVLNQSVLSFRGMPAKVLGGQPPLHEASTGRVWTTEGEYYPAVYGLEWIRQG